MRRLWQTKDSNLLEEPDYSALNRILGKYGTIPFSGEIEKDVTVSVGEEFDNVVGWNGLEVGLRSHYPSEMARRVKGAVGSYFMHLSSVDYYLKRYLHEDDNEQSFHKVSCSYRLDEVIKHIIEIIYNEVQKQTSVPLDDGAVRLAADLSLMRFPSTLFGTLCLANRGLFYETATVARFALEQLAWVYASTSSAQLEDVFELEAEKAISNLKKLLPTSGKLYGRLSKYSHWRHSTHEKFVSIDENDQTTSTIFRSDWFVLEAFALILVLIDCYGLVFETLYNKNLSTKHFLDAENLPNKNRITKLIYSQIFEKYEDNEEIAFFWSIINF